MPEQCLDQHLKDITKLQVIDDRGKCYMKHFRSTEIVSYKLEDDGKTLTMYVLHGDHNE